MLVGVEQNQANIFNELKLDNLAGSRVANKSVDVVYDLPVGLTVDKSSGQLAWFWITLTTWLKKLINRFLNYGRVKELRRFLIS